MSTALRIIDDHLQVVQATVPIVNNGTPTQFLRLKLGSVIPVGLLVVYSKGCPACGKFAPEMTALTQNPSIPIVLYEVIQREGVQSRLPTLSATTATPITTMPTIYLVVNSTVIRQIPISGSTSTAQGILTFIRSAVMPRLSQHTPSFQQAPMAPMAQIAPQGMMNTQFPEVPMASQVPMAPMVPMGYIPQQPQQHQQPQPQQAQQSQQGPSMSQLAYLCPGNFTIDETMNAGGGVVIGLCDIIHDDEQRRKMQAQDNIGRVKQMSVDRA